MHSTHRAHHGSLHESDCVEGNVLEARALAVLAVVGALPVGKFRPERLGCVGERTQTNLTPHRPVIGAEGSDLADRHVPSMAR